jgi:hypothetical protein
MNTCPTPTPDCNLTGFESAHAYQRQRAARHPLDKPHIRIRRVDVSLQSGGPSHPHFRITLYNPNLPKWMRHKELVRIRDAQEAFDTGAALAVAYKTTFATGPAHDEA